jgi:tetratricopeptide (TPR) repeat protein
LKSLGIFIFYNLLYGVRGGVDNSAHLGGLVAGLILGAAIPPMVRASTDPQYIPVGPTDHGREADESRANRVAFTVAAVSAVVLIFGFAALHAKRTAVARYGSAVRLIKAGKPDQAVAQLQESVNLDPDVYFSQAMLGELLLQQQDPSAAAEPLERVASMYPNAYDVQHNLALAYLGAGRADTALPFIYKSLAAQKDSTWPSQFVRGIAEAEVADYPLASADLRAVIKAKPDFAEAKELLAQIPSSGAPATKPQIKIPYDKLVMKSEYWPLYP